MFLGLEPLQPGLSQRDGCPRDANSLGRVDCSLQPDRIRWLQREGWRLSSRLELLLRGLPGLRRPSNRICRRLCVVVGVLLFLLGWLFRLLADHGGRRRRLVVVVLIRVVDALRRCGGSRCRRLRRGRRWSGGVVFVVLVLVLLRGLGWRVLGRRWRLIVREGRNLLLVLVGVLVLVAPVRNGCLRRFRMPWRQPRRRLCHGGRLHHGRRLLRGDGNGRHQWHHPRKLTVTAPVLAVGVVSVVVIDTFQGLLHGGDARIRREGRGQDRSWRLRPSHDRLGRSAHDVRAKVPADLRKKRLFHRAVSGQSRMGPRHFERRLRREERVTDEVEKSRAALSTGRREEDTLEDAPGGRGAGQLPAPCPLLPGVKRRLGQLVASEHLVQQVAPDHNLTRDYKAVGAWGKPWYRQLPHVRVRRESEERRLILAQPAHELALDFVEHNVARVHVHAGDAGLTQEVHRLEQLPGVDPNELGIQWHRSRVAVLGVGRLARPPLHLVQRFAQGACRHILALHHDVTLTESANELRVCAGQQEWMPRAVDSPENRSNHWPPARQTAWNLLMPSVHGGRRTRDVHHDGGVRTGCNRPLVRWRRGVDLPRHEAELDNDGFVLLFGPRVEEGLDQAL